MDLTNRASNASHFSATSFPDNMTISETLNFSAEFVSVHLVEKEYEIKIPVTEHPCTLTISDLKDESGYVFLLLLTSKNASQVPFAHRQIVMDPLLQNQLSNISTWITWKTSLLFLQLLSYPLCNLKRCNAWST
jgi:hypothetical protein